MADPRAIPRNRHEVAPAGDPRSVSFSIFAAILAGALLRLIFLGSQVVAGDEIHPIHVVARASLARILTHYQAPDNCIPITAFCKLLFDTVGLEEWGFRFLSYGPGILLLIVALRASRPFLGSAERLLLAILLAGSPMLVFWSRTARPYSAITLLGLAAVLALARFARARQKRWLFASAACQFGLFYCSPTTLPSIAGIGLAGALWGFQHSGSRTSIGARARKAVVLLLPSVLAATLTLIAIAPAIPSLVEAVDAARSRDKLVQPDRWTHLAQLVYGLPHSDSDPAKLLLLLPVALTLLGVARFCRNHRGLAVSTLVFLSLPMLGFAFAGIRALTMALATVRYNAVILPFCLFLLVYGFDGCRRGLAVFSSSLRAAVLASGFGLVSILVLTGPLRSGLPPGYPFGLLYSSMTQVERLDAVDFRNRAPAFYRERLSDSEAPLIECLSPRMPQLKLVAQYQQFHGKRVVRCNLRNPVSDLARMKFRTFRFGLQEVMSKSPEGAYIVLHRNAVAERLYLNGDSTRPERTEPSGDRQRRWPRNAERLFGKPVYEDEWILVFRNRPAQLAARAARR